MSWSKPYIIDYGATGDTVKTGITKLDDDLTVVFTYLNLLKSTHVGSSAPSSPDTGQLWLDSSHTPPILKRYTGSAWAVLTVAYCGSSAPSSPQTGTLWLDTSTSPGTPKIYDGSSWVSMSADAAKGLITSPDITSKDQDKVTIGGFSIEINGRVYTLGSSTDKTVTGLSASTWYYLFAQAPSSGTELSASDITYSSTAPTYDHAKCGWYDTTGDKRCFGVFYSDSSSQVMNFIQTGRLVFLMEPITFLSTTTPASTWTAVSVGGPSLGSLLVSIGGRSQSNSSGYGVYGYVRSYGQSDAVFVGGLDVSNNASTYVTLPGATKSVVVGGLPRLLTNTSGQIEYKVSSSSYSISSYKLYLREFWLPGGF
ncbi:MAG: hypothetical protein ABIN58_11880 [candidate division WOR-3 bacterium]